MQIQVIDWDVTRNGQQAHKYILTNDNGMEVTLSDFSASILDICLPVGGQLRSVALGYDTLEEYYQEGPEFAGFVGRNGNRIAHGRVTLDGVTYQLEINNNGHNLHSGHRRSYNEFYAAATGEEADSVWVAFSRVSPHMEQKFPGNLEQTVRYTLTKDNAVVIDYHMVSDMTTVINPTNHTYFNLMGHSSGTVLAHRLAIYADAFLPTDDTLIPTGEIRSVENTPFDFRAPKAVGQQIEEDYEPLHQAGGYDHNFCFANDGVYKQVARLWSPDDSVCMSVFTDRCGMQLYTGNFLDGRKGKNGARYQCRNGLCLETQVYPNGCNTPGFPSSVQPAGVPFVSRTAYQFQWK